MQNILTELKHTPTNDSAAEWRNYKQVKQLLLQIKNSEFVILAAKTSQLNTKIDENLGKTITVSNTSVAKDVTVLQKC